MTNDTPQPVPAETVRLMEAWATVAGPDHVWAGNEPHPWIEDIEGGCAVQGCVVDRVDHYVPPGLHLSCLGCGAAGFEGPTYCATHGDWLCERCITAIRSGGAEARDATGLLPQRFHRRLLDYWWHHGKDEDVRALNGVDSAPAIVRDINRVLAAPCPESASAHCEVDHAEAVRAALAAAPQEPRLTENERLRAELEERDATFRLRWDADMRAIATWQAEDPERRSLTWPDHADMVVWLLDKLDQVHRDLQQYHDGGAHSLAAIDQILAEARIDAA